MPTINWFPGHMKKTQREIKENLKLVDAVIEIRDARIPRSSANPDIDKLCEGKPRVILLNKSDLSDKAKLNKWISYYQSKGIKAIPVDTLKGNGVNKIVEECKNATKEKMDAWVSKYGDEIECCVAGNDAMALGALSAVEAAGFNTDGEESSKYIPIYGIDALPEILSKIESGEITGSVLQDAKTQGQTIVKMAENLTSGKDAVDGIEGVEVEEEAKAVRVPYQAITKDNLDLAKSTYE